ncbi:uncharacterized protein [Cicer arietinum]|uniref:Nuclear nucleic acid-binding protein C1D n=1 Tax=Cicer arietinum TaxID=3827 RepID=A0A1S2Y3K0_CICAR|nr:nuclear nucleic acid-binding protein C1D-like [Cicer arietinum]
MVKESELESVTIPESPIESLNRTLHNVEQLETQLPQFLTLSDPDLLSQLPLFQRAHSLFSLAKLTSTLFSLKLKCRGINPNDHPFKSELDRLTLCQKRLEDLPDLSEEQWQDMVDKSRREELQMNYEEQTGQKRKYPSSEEEYGQFDTKEFLDKSIVEFHGGGNSGSSIKEAIVIDLSDDDDDDDEYM